MPLPQAIPGETVPCSCGKPNRPETHFVCVRTRYRHMEFMGLIDANDTGNATDTATTTDEEDSNSSGNEGEDEDNGLEEDNHMDIDGMGNHVFRQDLYYDYGDREMGYRSESDRSETPSSTGSWLNVPTPPPTPPSTPPPGSDDEEQASDITISGMI